MNHHLEQTSPALAEASLKNDGGSDSSNKLSNHVQETQKSGDNTGMWNDLKNSAEQAAAKYLPEVNLFMGSKSHREATSGPVDKTPPKFEPIKIPTLFDPPRFPVCEPVPDRRVPEQPSLTY